LTQPTASSGKGRTNLIVLIVVLVVVIMAIAGVAWYKGSGSHPPRYEFSAVNVEVTHPDLLGGTTTSSSTLDSFNANGTNFTYTLTLNGVYYYAHSVSSVNLNSPGFSIVSLSPTLPVPLSQGGSVAISLTISGPPSGYQGVLTINVDEGS
jgi:flagellar basal body-associated protein FliL